MRTLKLLCSLALALLLVWLCEAPVGAHPISQGGIAVSVFPDHLDVDVRVAFEEILIASTGQKLADVPESTAAALQAHGAYLLNHLHFSSSNAPLKGTLLRVSEPAAGAAKPGADDRIVFSLRFALPAGARSIQLTQDVLNEIDYAPGNRWEATYVVNISQENAGALSGLLLTSGQPISFDCAIAGDAARLDAAGGWSTLKAFCHHGILHILTGYDHLLFITTLVLAALSFWDLFKVVGTFTIAHGITLTLSVLNIVRLPERIVEPMIAASIIYVALENAFFPQRSRSWTRLGAAFFFGLFHGLGFAGGLLEAMEGMPGVAIAVALVGFSVGVEIGHQIVVVPLYGILRTVRSAQKDEDARQRVFSRIRKFASMAITVAGVFYLAAALGFLAL